MIIQKITFNGKRGIVLPETLKIIIGVLCILLLIYLAAKLYTIFTRSYELEQAKATLDALVGKAEALKDGENLDYLIIGPRKWNMVSLESSKEFCICPFSSDANKQMSLCRTQGVCKVSSKTIKLIQTSQVIESGNSFYMSPIPIPISLEQKAGIVELIKSTNPLTTSDKTLFDNFLQQKFFFADKGNIEVEKQIIFYVNSGDWGRNLLARIIFKGEDKMKADLTKNIQTIFMNYEYPINLKIKEKRLDASNQINNQIILSLDAGKDRVFKEGEKLPAWPIYEISNPEGKIKNIIIEITRKNE